MKTFPMFLKTTARRIVIVGGGEEAVRKCRLVLKTDASILIVSNAPDPELVSLEESGRIEVLPDEFEADYFHNAVLAFIATGDEAIDIKWAELARRAGAVVNIVDRPELCDAYTPSIVDRDPLVVAIGTEGAAPVLARQVKTKLETWLEPRLGDFVGLAGRLRDFASERISNNSRREFWRWVFTDTPRKLFAAGSEREAATLIKNTIANGGLTERTQVPVALVGAGPGAADLLTLRAVQRLQEADIIFYDRLIGPDVLELARRDADRVYVGKTPNAASWPQEKINALIVAAGKQGKNVVRLKCGDPGMFARGAEEAHALREAGLRYEIVPGVTSAVAASAAAGHFLTERGEIETVVFCTGHLRDGDGVPNWVEHLKRGSAVSMYMGVSQIEGIQSAAFDAHCPNHLPITIIENASHSSQRILETTLRDMVDDVVREGIQAPAIIQMKYPKSFEEACNENVLVAM